jgi:hypothetical protein
MTELADERIANALALSDEELLAQAPDNMVLSTDTIAAARLSRRFGICKLTLTLEDGSRRRWLWMNTAMCGSYSEIARALRRALGDRISARHG